MSTLLSSLCGTAVALAVAAARRQKNTIPTAEREREQLSCERGGGGGQHRTRDTLRRRGKNINVVQSWVTHLEAREINYSVESNLTHFCCVDQARH